MFLFWQMLLTNSSKFSSGSGQGVRSMTTALTSFHKICTLFSRSRRWRLSYSWRLRCSMPSRLSSFSSFISLTLLQIFRSPKTTVFFNIVTVFSRVRKQLSPSLNTLLWNELNHTTLQVKISLLGCMKNQSLISHLKVIESVLFVSIEATT